MSDFNKIASDYIALWNETDTARRARLLGEQWTPRATYVDPLAKAAGRDEIGAYIGGVHQRVPGYRFPLLGAAEGHGDHRRFSRTPGPDGTDAPIAGSVVVALAPGRI